MTILEELTNAGLPVITAEENGRIIMGAMTEAQDEVYRDIVFRYFLPAKWQSEQDYNLLKQQLRDAYQAMLARLEEIQNATSPTNAQVIQAVKDLALYQERVLKFLNRLMN